MTIHFRSLISGSSGNALLLCTKRTRLLIDAGFSSQERCRQMLSETIGGPERLTAALLTHAHSDHISYPACRVFQHMNTPVFLHRKCERSLRGRRADAFRMGDLHLKLFTNRRFRIGEFTIKPFQVPHYPDLHTCGFEIRADAGKGPRKIVIGSDFYDYAGLLKHFENADLIYLEANYDPELLRLHPNPNTEFHLKNENAGRLLRHVLDRSKSPPAAIMIGHLSEQRNDPEIARSTVLEILRGDDGHTGVPLHVAPRHTPSETIILDGRT